MRALIGGGNRQKQLWQNKFWWKEKIPEQLEISYRYRSYILEDLENAIMNDNYSIHLKIRGYYNIPTLGHCKGILYAMIC